KTIINKVEEGDYVPKGNDLIVLSNYFKVSFDSILGLSNETKVANMNEYRYSPESISAGLPLLVDGVTNYDNISIPDELMGKYAGHKDIIISKINGDSMDKLMNDGSFIAIKPVDSAESLNNGDIVVFSHNHEY